MYFDGASTQSLVGASVVLISPSKENIYFPYKLDFKTTNNIEEYEALLLPWDLPFTTWVHSKC